MECEKENHLRTPKRKGNHAMQEPKSKQPMRYPGDFNEAVYSHVPAEFALKSASRKFVSFKTKFVNYNKRLEGKRCGSKH